MADIPDRDADFDNKATLWLIYINANLAHFGLVAGDVTGVNNAKSSWDLQYAQHLTTQQVARTVTQDKDDARGLKPGGLEPQLRAIRNRIAAYPGTTNADRVALDLAVPGEPSGGGSPLPPSRPVGSIVTAERLVHTLKWIDEASQKKARPAGVKATEIYGALTATATASPPTIDQFVYIATDTASPYRREFEPEDGGKVAHYLLRYILADDDKGSWSERVSATIVAA